MNGILPLYIYRTKRSVLNRCHVPTSLLLAEVPKTGGCFLRRTVLSPHLYRTAKPLLTGVSISTFIFLAEVPNLACFFGWRIILLYTRDKKARFEQVPHANFFIFGTITKRELTIYASIGTAYARQFFRTIKSLLFRGAIKNICKSANPNTMGFLGSP